MSIKREVRSLCARYYIIVFLTWFATALPLALTVLLAQARGLSLFEIGAALGVYSLTVVLLELPTGGLADAVGRKRVTLLALGLGTLYSLILLFAFSFPTLLLALILYGVSRALASGALDAWFVDALQATDPSVDLQPALAGAETVSLLALGLGALIGGALPRLFSGLPVDGTAVLTPLAVPIVASLFVKLVLLLAVAGLIKDDRSAASRPWRNGLRAVPEMVLSAVSLSRVNPRLRLLMSASFAGGLAILSLEALWQPFFAELPGISASALPTQLFGIIMAGSYIAGMGGNLLSVPMTRRLGGRHGLVSAFARCGQGVAILGLAATAALAPAMSFFWLAYLMSGVGLSPHAALLNNEIPGAHRSAMLSVQSLAFYAGGFVGGTLLGHIADRTGIANAWLTAGVLTVLSLLPYVMLEYRYTPSPSHVSR